MSFWSKIKIRNSWIKSAYIQLRHILLTTTICSVSGDAWDYQCAVGVIYKKDKKLTPLEIPFKYIQIKIRFSELNRKVIIYFTRFYLSYSFFAADEKLIIINTLFFFDWMKCSVKFVINNALQRSYPYTIHTDIFYIFMYEKE